MIQLIQNSKKISAISIASSIFIGTTTSSFAVSTGSSLGECYNNFINHCNQHTNGYPDNCYNEGLKLCDQTHASAQLSGINIKALQNSALKRAKRSRLKTPVVAPVRR